MGISIYYSASRTKGLSEAEHQEIEAVVGRYSVKEKVEEYHRTGVGWNGEDFCLYNPPLDSPNDILDGATRLPDSTEDAFWAAIQHWCRALSEIRRLLPDALWRVHIDDHEIHWDEERQEYDP